MASHQFHWISVRTVLALLVLSAAATALLLRQFDVPLNDGRLAALTFLVVAGSGLAVELIRHRFRFSLRVFLVAITTLALLLGLYSDRSIRAFKRDRGIRRLLELGGTVSYESRDNWYMAGGIALPSWVRSLYATDDFGRLRSVKIPATLGDSDLRSIRWALIDVDQVQLNHTQVTDAGLQHLGQLNQLRELLLGGNQTTKVGVQHLTKLTNLRELTFWQTHVARDSLANLDRLPQLTDMNFYSTRIDDGSLAQLAKLPRLRTLRLNYCQLSDANMGHLAQIKELKQLHIWVLTISDQSIPYLKELRQLEQLHILHSRITADGAKKLRELLPDCKLHFFPEP